MKYRILILAAATATLWALAGCGIDSSLQSTPPEAPGSYTIQVNVQPLTTLRTEETWGLWTVPAQAVFQTTFEEAEEEAAKRSGVASAGHEITVGRTTTNGFGIVLTAGEARPFFRMGHDGMTMHMPEDHETHHLRVFLEDAVGGHHPHGNANIPGAKVHLEITVEGEEQEIELRTVQGAHGFRYEANSSIPLGAYDVKVHVTPPGFDRTEETKDRWTSEIEAALPGYDFSSGSGSASVEIDGMKISLRAGSPKIYGAYGMGHLPLWGDETVNFSVRLEDVNTPASGEGEMLAECPVSIIVINNETGATTSQVLTAMYGANGFYYGANIALPEGTSVVGPSDTGGDGHADDGHTH